MSTVEISLRGTREARKLLDSLSGRELVNRTRRGVRAGAAVMRTDLRSRVRSGRYPKSFRKIATKNSTHGGVTGTSPETRVGPTSPLHNIFEGGAGDHTIKPGPRGVLSNTSDDRVGHAVGRGERPFFTTRAVRHPGMAARPLTTPAFEATKDDAAEAAMKKILEGIR